MADDLVIDLVVTEFGFSVMGRISLLIGRIDRMKEYSASEFYYATPILSICVIICLIIWAYLSKGTSQDQTFS